MLKEWELEKGVEIKTNKRQSKYTEKQLKQLIKSNPITVKTDKGLEYIQEM